MMNGDFSNKDLVVRHGMSEGKRNIITFSLLGGILVALILIYAFAVAPLLYAEKSTATPPEIFDGEATNGVTVSLYPAISDQNLLEIKVKNEKDEYSFIQKKDENGKVSMAIKGHEKIPYDNLVYAYLSVFAKEPRVPLGGTIIRDLNEAQMAPYGTTELLCSAQVEVKYLENGKEKTHTLLIGNKVISGTDSYYVAVKGRGSVYCVNASSVEKAILLKLTDYISPSIYKKFSSASEAGISIKNLVILLTTQAGGNAKEVILLERDEQESTSTSASFKFTFPEVYPQKIIASNDHVLSVLNKLYVSFIGDKIVALDPDQATLEKYGLGKNQEQYMVYGKLIDENDKNPLPAFYISKEFTEGEGEDAKSYHYVLSTYYEELTIVRLPANELAFLKSDNQTMLDWAATNSVFAGFSQYLIQDDELGAPGVKTIRIRTKDFNEEFIITIGSRLELTVSTADGKYVFTDNPNNDGPYTKNQFSNLYTLLLYYPMPSRFTAATKDNMAEVKTDENIIYELEVQMNDGKLYKYTYYTLDVGYAGYALCESSTGNVDENGNFNYTNTQTIFDVKSRQIGAIAEAYKIIMEGGSINPLDYIY